jgi:hypothetical protein
VVHRLVANNKGGGDASLSIPVAVFASLRKFACFSLPEDKRTPEAVAALTRRQRCVLRL